MKVVSNEALTKLIQLVKSSFIKADDIVQTQEVTLADVATSGDYYDLLNKPTIPTVNNATLTIQKNGSNVATFTANASSNVTANIEVPTVDQAYSASSTNAQSGVAVASAISTKADSSTVSNINSRVTTIESEIPAQASSSNQLADKNFVNSSIATNTANFIGTFNSVAELEAYSGAKDDNDYAFVISTDAAGNTVYNRYKWNGTAWLFEYALNNSSFTANQWAAINSGATPANIGQIATNTTAIATKADDNAVVHKTGNETIGGVKTFNNSIHFNSSVYIDAAAGYEGGEISFAKAPNSSLTADIHLDSWKNSMRIFGCDSNNVNHLVFDADIEENKVKVPTPEISSNDNTAATTAYVKNVLSALYPVGSIYIGTQSTCPLATLINGSTWELVSAGRVLQGSDSGHNAGTTIEAGLPNHTHHIGVHNANGQSSGGGYIPWDSFNAGSVIVNSGVNGESGNGNWTDRDPTQYNYDRPQMTNASDDNSIYGNSNTVQPPAYVVNIWRRTA